MEQGDIVISRLTVPEKNQLENIIERINSLNHLIIVLNENQEYLEEKKLYSEAIIDDIKNTKIQGNNWWINIIKKYELDSKKRYFVNFKNCDIIMANTLKCENNQH